MKTLEGMTLEEIQEAVKKTTRGHYVRIYSIEGSSLAPIHGSIKFDGGWRPAEWRYDGKDIDDNALSTNLKLPDDEIDWSAFPVDTLIETINRNYRFLDGIGNFFIEGRCSLTRLGVIKCPGDAKLAEGRIMPWFGGEQPVPDNVEVRTFYADGRIATEGQAAVIDWKVAKTKYYQLTGRIL